MSFLVPSPPECHRVETQPGDTLVYLPDWWNPIDRIIARKTWMRCCHTEVYIGDGKTVAARLSGVRVYEVDWRGLAAVLEPVFSFHQDVALSWFYSQANGQGYDFWGLFDFFQTHRIFASDRRMWCSECSTRFYRAGGGTPFNPECDADRISPAQFCQTSGFRFRWRSPKMPV